ncbi:hypothetical protein [Microbacterium allomyrinae]|uniref:Uncharacterized protein n=1 Tax=Microbacterium allomyrinae TaxID=2830666 RepID=A0A9X1LYC9_9MICO|nr:hypothetical protein [Microbacterium allomyrinae]MCC2034036.1 hypothetical protein [Microbacterium allomyrinae]
MAHEVDRRGFLVGGLLLTAVVTAGCAPQRRPAVASPPSSTAATATPEAPPATAPPAADGRPVPQTSFGPNGTHYPEQTPWLGAAAATDLIVDCDWTAIAEAITALSATQVADGVVLRVKPGTLPGGGANSSSEAVLANAGDGAWTRHVAICPRDGVGSVTISAGIRLDKCSWLALFGFVSPEAFALTQCASIQIGWSRFDAANITRGGTDLAFYELVLGFRYNDEDTVGIRPTEQYAMTGISRYGCVFGPSVKAADSGAHCDTMQLEGTGTGTFGPFTSVDCVDYGSSNAALLLHTQVTLAEFRHCMVLGEELPWLVFPLRPGDYEGTPNAFAGGCQDVRAYDSIIAGPIGSMGFTRVEGTTLSYQPQASQEPRVSGTWDVDTSVARWTKADIMSRQSIPDYETDTLAGIWTW